MKTPSKKTEPKAEPKADFSFPQEAADSIKGAQDSVVGLPFPLTVWYIKNGSPQAKGVGGTAYTGGFACGDIPQNALTLIDITGEEVDVDQLFEERVIENTNREGGSYETVEYQAIEVAPFLHRRRFIEGRSHTQVLALLRLPGEIVSVAMLSARGYQSSILLDEIGKVASSTAAARKDLGNPPAALFWTKVGMPSKPEFRSVGKAATSIITPVKAAISNEDLTECYIGDDNALAIADMLAMEETLIWRDAWKDSNQSKPEAAPYGKSPNTGNELDIPF